MMKIWHSCEILASVNRQMVYPLLDNVLLQIPSANLTLIHELCLPGYFLEGERCECREGTNTVLFCLPDQKGILLAVSITALYIYVHA